MQLLFSRSKIADFRICCAKVIDLQAYKFSDLNSKPFERNLGFSVRKNWDMVTVAAFVHVECQPIG
ncbi:hypothetical protein HanIR_Chr16g0813151 [Helianthus annuus]|nr:hypothetical protein HanIR_Chr16g0813151 [Helianthus annuus]